MDENISRRRLLEDAKKLFLGSVSTRILSSLELAATLTAISTIDVGFNSLIQKAMSEELTIGKFIRPKEWSRLTLAPENVTEEIHLANFSEEVFPKKLEYEPGKNTLVVSAVWQTAALYDAKGKLMQIGGDELKFLTSTGKVDHPTELGMYKIQSKKDKDYRSGKYKIIENGKEIGAKMPYAKHLGKVKIGKDGELYTEPSDGTAIHARSNVEDDTTTTFMSHGCIGLPESVAEDFHDRLKIDDQVLVIGEKFPTGVKSNLEMVEILQRENEEYLEYLKQEVELKPEEVKKNKKCFIYCSATGENIFDFMSTDPNLNPYRENDRKTVRIPETGAECSTVRKSFYQEAIKRCKN